MNKLLPNQNAQTFVFATKAVTLERLAPYVTLARLCEQVMISIADWRSDRDWVLAEVLRRFSPAPLAVRSSAAHEDGIDSSMAGVHLSHLGVSPKPDAIAQAIDKVFDSYEEPSDDDQVLVQPMVEDVAISGVVLTRDLDTGSPYYVVNYDDISGRTDTVTGGAESKEILVRRSKPDVLKSSRFQKLLAAVMELEAITDVNELDIEFCITRSEEIYILQVRPLAARHRWEPIADHLIDRAVDGIRDDVESRMGPVEGLSGPTTMFSDMADWNPAEMIGDSPKPLALSLYKYLITERVWAEARDLMGYRRVEAPLLVDFCGRPYIDVRLSLNSFMPAGLDEGLADRLVGYQIERLRRKPLHHDKIEFEIAVTCRDFSFPEERDQLLETGFDENHVDALEDSLAAITGFTLGGLRHDIPRLVGLSSQLLKDPPGTSSLKPLEKITALLEACKVKGTLPFSQLARYGFVGILFLKSLVRRGVFDQDQANKFMLGIHTVAVDLVADMSALGLGHLDQDAFLRRYGHLRPGTYDILSWRYDERPDLYLGHIGREISTEPESFVLTPDQHAGIEKLLVEFGYDLAPEELMAYITAAVQAREKAKFFFTRSISDSLLAMVEWGEGMGFSRDDLSFLAIGDLMPGADIEVLKDKIAVARDAYRLTRAIRLPHLIPDPSRIDIVGLPLGRPTFITGRSVTAPIRLLSLNDAPDIDGHIVLIESADPGFDWIFSQHIVGLVTKYGGANSHMAIRCTEFGLPAAIGCGERRFETLARGTMLELNCAAGKVSAL